MTTDFQSPYHWISSCDSIPSPSFCLGICAIAKNTAILREIQRRTGCSILLAQKAFSLWKLYPELSPYLAGTAASSRSEARLGKEHFPGEVHTYSPAYSESEVQEVLELSDAVVFNSLTQLYRFEQLWQNADCSIGLRVNPNCSLVDHDAFDPCGTGSRFGVTANRLPQPLPAGVKGFHLHGLCGGSAEQFEQLLLAFESQFNHWFNQLEWINFGGGARITSDDFDREQFIRVLNRFSHAYSHIKIYLEPGEAVSHHCGILIASVLDIFENGEQIAILDISAAAHLPDILAFGYRPIVFNSTESGYQYHLTGKSCLAGDSVGRYSFEKPLAVGDHIIFGDMAGYSMVKTTMFNGLDHPSIYAIDGSTAELLREFHYEDFKNRLS